MRAVALGLMLVVASLASAHAAQPRRVNLDLVPSESLPGIPVSLRFTVTNNGAVEVPFPRCAELIVRPNGGEEFC